MSKTIDQGKAEVAALCRYFATNRQAFLAPGVKEAHIRQSLIDPLFEALGWDVRNTAMIAPQYREVIPEDSLDVEGQQKAPDYTFRVGTLPKFYVEAKKCGASPFDLRADGVLDDVCDNVGRRVVNATGFAHFGLVFDLGLVACRQPNHLAQEPFIDGSKDFDGQDAEMIGRTVGKIETLENLCENFVVD